MQAPTQKPRPKLPMPSGWFRIATNGWTKPLTKVLPLKVHIQDIAENSVDFGHFAAVHEYSDLQDPTLRIDGPRLYSKFAFTRKNPFFPMSDVQSIFDTDIHGLGLSVTDLRVPSTGSPWKPPPSSRVTVPSRSSDAG